MSFRGGSATLVRGGRGMSKLLGIDVGGTKVALALADGEGRILARERRPTEPSGDAERDLQRLVRDAQTLLQRAAVKPGELGALGLSLPGPVDA